MVFGSVFREPKQVKATGFTLVYDMFKDPKKIIVLLTALSVSTTAWASDQFNSNMETFYNALPDGAKTAIKAMDVTGDNYYLPKADFQQAAYDLYVTMGFKNFADGITAYFDKSTNTLSPVNNNDMLIGVKSETTVTENSVYRTEYYSNTFSSSTKTWTINTVYNQYFSGGNTTIIFGNFTTFRASDEFGKVPTTYRSYPVSVPLNSFTNYCTANASTCAANPSRNVIATYFSFDPTAFTNISNLDTGTNWFGTGGNRYYLYYANGIPWTDSITITPLTTSTIPFTMVDPVNPSVTFPDITWGNAVPGDIDIYPDNVVDDDIYFGGATSDVIDLTPELIQNPVINPAGTITNPILDVLIHLPAYLEATGDAINDFATSLVDSASGALGSTLGAIGGWLGNLINGVQLGLAAILAYLGSMLTDLIGAMGAQVTKIMDGIRDFFGGFLDFITDFINGLKVIIDFFGRLFQFLWTNFIRFLMLLYNTLFLGVFTMLSQFILGLKSLMAVLPTPLDDISYLMIDITVFLTMLSVIIKFLTNSKGKS